MSSPRATIIMRCKNSDWVIDQALAGTFSQDYDDFNMVVVDSGSTDRTLDIVRQFPVKLVEIPAAKYYPGDVLNDAIKDHCTGDIAIFQNSDTVPMTPRSLGALVGAFDDDKVMGAFGRQAARPEAETWVRRDYLSSFPPSGDAPEWMPYSLPFAGMRKTLWKERGFYSDAWGSEDTDWGYWARKNGHRIDYVPDALVMHSHDYTLKQIYGRQFIEGEADAFIHRDQDTVLDTLKRAAGATARDALACLKAADLPGLAMAAPRRLVYSWAYHKGHTLGESRIASGDTDRSAGQEAVLTRHDSA